MDKKNILILLFAITFLFSPSFFHGFLGDDEVVIVNNHFYDSWGNVSRLFQKNYLTKARDLYQYHGSMDSSGSVAYRPITSLSFFLDAWIWKKIPFGYHLTNVILHVLCALSFYFLVKEIIKNQSIALISAILCGLHPIQVEAVSHIGYRSDLIATLFAVNSFAFFIRYKKNMNFVNILLSLMFFALGLFAKESIVILPLIFFAYDRVFSEKRIKKSIHLFYIAVTLGYLFIYFEIFPNTTLNNVDWMGGNILSHLVSVFWILALYFKDLILPFFVKMIPPVYAPEIRSFLLLKIMISFSVVILGIFVYLRNLKKEKEVSFFLLWFVLGLLPVMNFIPNPNPMAHRYLYFPSMGLFVVFAMGIVRFIEYGKQTRKFPNAEKICIFLAVAGLISFSMPLVLRWKSNFSVGRTLIEQYPRYHKGYAILGIEYCKKGMWREAKEALSASIKMGSEDPRVYYLLGLCFLDQPEKAEGFLNKAIALNPNFSSPYLAMGRMYFLQNKVLQSMGYLKKSLNIFPTYTGYGYFIQALQILGRNEEARKIYEEAKENINVPNQIRSLEKMLEVKRQANPVDIGI